MKCKVEKTKNANEVKIELTVEAQKFEEAIKKVYFQSAKYFNIPGFRKGKAPLQIVEKYYGKEIFYEDAFNELAPEVLEEAVKENNLEIVSRPEIDITQIEKGKDLIFTAVMQTKPEVELGKYKGIEIKKIEYNVTDEDIDHELHHMQEHNSRLVNVENRPVEKGDTTVIDFEGFVDGVAFDGGKAEGHELEIGSNTFIPGFEDQIIGMKMDEEKDINVKFPDEYFSKDLAGKDATFKVKLHEIKKKELPKLDDEFAKDVSEFDTLEELKKDIKEKKEKQNIIRLFYKHLMNGISHALPFLVTSGVLYGILYLFKDQVLTNQLLILTSNVQQLISIMIIPIISAYIADSIADRPGMLSGFAGGLIVCQGISITSISTSSPSLLAGIIAGFLAGFVSLMLRKLFSYLPQCLKGIEASLFHPIISTIIVTLLMFYLNSYLYIGHTYILNYVSLVESQISTKVLFGFVLGMMMAIDNGGPINKTAYVFGIGMLISYDYYPMAAVMAGGMIPPFVIALTATLFKDRFEVRNDALMNYINGISFISEGAIPFIQKESQIILPACCLSAGLAGALSMYFNCSIASPHGGLFLIWMVQNPISYLSLIVCSTLVGTILLILFTKLKKES